MAYGLAHVRQFLGIFCLYINIYLTPLVVFFRNRNLRISATKSSVSLFTSWTKEVRKILSVKVEGNAIPTVRYPKILGIIFDNLLYFDVNTTNIDSKVRRRNKILKVLAGTT